MIAGARLRAFGLLWPALACTTQSAPPGARDTSTGSDSTIALQAIDSTIPPAIAGENGWNFQRTASVDLAGDSVPERVVLTARVELVRGRPAWDDGQPWQVYVESPRGTRSYVYAQRLQLGSLDMRVTRGDSAGRGTVLLIEHLPDRLRILEVFDAGSGPTVALRLERMLNPRGEIASPRLP
jgi:hypothetical protein